MKRSSILMMLVLVSATVFAVMPASAPGDAEKPTWNVGDSWSMGKSIDISQYNQDIQDILDLMGTGGSASLSGGVGIYNTLKVVDDDASVEGVTCYKTSLKGALGVNAFGEMSMSISDEFMGQMSMSGSATIELDVWIDGHVYFTVEKIAIKKVDITIKADVKAEGSADVTMEGISQSMSFLVEGKSLNIHYTTIFTPAFDFFDFPIVDGETWHAPDEDTEAEITGSASGSIRMKMTQGGMEVDTTVPLNEFLGSVSETDTIYKNTMELSAEKSGEKYNIIVDPGDLGIGFGGIGGFGIPDIPKFVIVYDPQDGFADSVGFEENGQYTPFMEPATEDEVDNFYMDPSASVPGPGLPLWLILLIVVIIIVVVVAVSAVAIKKRKKPSAVPPPGQQMPPGQQQYPPQQPPPQGPPPQYPQSPPPPPP